MKPGDNVIIRTVGPIYTGKIVKITRSWIYLVDAAWIPDSGRWANCLAGGKINECEPYPDGDVVPIARGPIYDVAPWRHDLPRVQK